MWFKNINADYANQLSLEAIMSNFIKAKFMPICGLRLMIFMIFMIIVRCFIDLNEMPYHS